MDDQQLLTPPMPPKLAHLMDQPALATAWEHQVAARQAEAAKISALLDYVAACRAEHQHEAEWVQEAAEKAAVHQAGLLVGFSDQTTTITLHAAEYARDHLPCSWEAFCRGLIDMLRLRKITTAAHNLTPRNPAAQDDGAQDSAELIRRLDPAAALEAIDRSLGDFVNWLTRFIAHLDEQAYTQACTQQQADRYVGFTHGTDGMSYIDARIPTVEAAAIQKRLTITARRQHARGEDAHPDPQTPAGAGSDVSAEAAAGERTSGQPTLAQRQADLFSAWLRTGDTPEEGATPVEAKIMIMIPEPTLTGETEEPAMAADRSWMLTAHQARTLASDPEAVHHWYQGRTRPNPGEADVDLLSATYVGRYPPARLRDALIFRDGVCTTQGCTIPAERSDIDHHTPFDAGGPTTAKNLHPLCRRHHRLKSHGFLTPPTPTATSRDGPSPPVSPQTPAPPVDLAYPTHPISCTA